MYHGTPAERAELRRTVMRQPVEKEKKKPTTRPKVKATGRNGKGIKTAKLKGGLRGRGRFTKTETDEDQEVEGDDIDSDSEPSETSSFPVVVTTYEMIIKDRVHLTPYNWG
jgi:ATP-dependent DNA helicase